MTHTYGAYSADFHHRLTAVREAALNIVWIYIIILYMYIM